MDPATARHRLSEIAREHRKLDAATSRRLQEELLPDLTELTSHRVVGQLLPAVFDEHTAAITTALAETERGQGITLAEVTIPFARECAHGDVAAGSILRVYQRGHQGMWREWKRRVEDGVGDPEVRAAALALCAELLLEYVTAGMEVTLQTHAAARETHLRGSAWQQREDVMAVLENRAVGTEAELAHRLDHPLSSTHLAFVCWPHTSGPTPAGGSVLAAAGDWAAEAAAGAREVATLMVPAERGSCWGWLSSPSALPLALPDPPQAIRIACGAAASGIEGFRRSHTEALRAQALAEGARQPRPLTQHSEVATLALLADDLAALRRFVADTLGGLASAEGRVERLRSTVRAYLDHGANVRAAARDLHFHRNTVQQRLEAAVRLRGRPLEDGRVALALALEIAEHYGEAVLDPAVAPAGSAHEITTVSPRAGHRG